MIAVDVPVTGSPYIAQTIRQGVELAASNLNGGGGVRLGSKSYLLKVKLYDNHLSAGTAVEDARRAIGAGAVTIVTDGTGVDATWQLARSRPASRSPSRTTAARASSTPRRGRTSSGSRRRTTGSPSATRST